MNEAKTLHSISLFSERDLFECAPYLSSGDISNYPPITLPLYTATLWHFHKTFASVREHDGPPIESMLKRSHIQINANNAKVFPLYINTQAKQRLAEHTGRTQLAEKDSM